MVLFVLFVIFLVNCIEMFDVKFLGCGEGCMILLLNRVVFWDVFYGEFNVVEGFCFSLFLFVFYIILDFLEWRFVLCDEVYSVGIKCSVGDDDVIGVIIVLDFKILELICGKDILRIDIRFLGV